MSVRIFLSAVISIATTTTMAAPAPKDLVSNLFGDRKYWQSFDWSKADSSRILSVGWSPYAGQQELQRKFVKEREISLLGLDFSSTLSQRNETSPYGWKISMVSRDAPESKCHEMITWATAQFGQSAAENDGSNEIAFAGKDGPKARILQRVTQWDLGSTRISAVCFGLISTNEDADSKNTSLIISVGHKSEEKQATPSFALSCTRKATYEDNSTRDTTPLTFLVNEYWNSIRTLQNEPIGSKANISSNSISFTINKDDLELTHDIDRITGTLTGTVTIKSKNKIFARVSGMCDRYNTASRKF